MSMPGKKAQAKTKTKAQAPAKTAKKERSGKGARVQVLTRHASVPSDLTKRPTLMLIYSNGCGYCQMLRPAWDASERPVREAGVNVLEIDSGVVPGLAPGTLLHDLVGRSDYRGGVPHICMFRTGKGPATPYVGDRSARSLVQYALGI